MEYVETLNSRVYASKKLVNWYSSLEFILPPERAILGKLAPHIREKKLLDIGVGGGRTTAFLLEISKDYTGIDYASGAVETARRKHPNANIFRADARDLGVFQSESFDFAMFSFNGIDYIIHEDRLTALKEIYRVLNRGGYFCFSTHNRDYRGFNKLPWQERSRFNPGHLKNCLHALYHLPRHLRLKHHEIYTDEYAIINDNAHGYALLTYYIGIGHQLAQLRHAGFIELEAYNMEGKPVDEDTTFPWTYYLARKPYVVKENQRG